jgi:general secretion pathway protein D
MRRLHSPRRSAVLLLTLLAPLLITTRAFSENGNPFGNIGQQGSPNEEESPDGGFGFPNPNTGAGNGGTPIPSAPPPPAPDLSNAPPPPARPGLQKNAGAQQRMQPPTARPTPPAPPTAIPPTAMPSTSPAQPSTTTTIVAGDKSKPAPKLADYLELDSSVKGLEVKNFDLPDKDIRDVVTLISKWTGKNFILDNKVRGKITIIGPSQVTLQEAYNAFLSALDANGLTTVQSGKFIRIIESAEARRAPVKTYAGEYAPRDDQFITRIFQLKYINADEVSREFRDLVTRQGKLFAYEPTNSIIITDTGSNIQRIRDILDSLDVKNFETTLHVLHVKNGSAKVIADMLGEIYGQPRGGAAGGQAAGAARSFQRSALERTRGGGIISKIIPDDQTNSLIILANQAGVTLLQQLVTKLDVKVTDTGRIHVYYCEYAKAEDLAATLASLSSGGAGGGKNTSRKTTVTSPTTSGATPGSPTPTAFGTQGGQGPVSAELEGGVKITSDTATNSLVIVANASDYKTLRRVLKKLDIPRLQVFVETAIMEISANPETDLNINTALGAPGARGFAGGFIGDTGSITNFITGSPLAGATIPIFAGPTFTGNISGQNVSVNTFMGLINFITKTTQTSILSTPQIIALDNEKATFKVQDEIPVQSTFTSQLNGATPGLTGIGTGNVTTLKTGIEINLTPQINAASRTIRLQIEQTVDTLSSNNNVPDLLKSIQKAKTSRVTNTTVVVHDEDYVMLGGLMSDEIDVSENKVPLLGDIPILGWLFKSRQTQVQKKNLVILLRPRIIGTTLEGAQLIGEKMLQRDDFIKRFTSDGDADPDNTKSIKSALDEQKKRGKEAPAFDYRNNEKDDEDTKDDKAKPGEKSELEEFDPEKPDKGSSPTSKGGDGDGEDGGQSQAPPPAQLAPPPDAPTFEIPPPGGG